MPVILSASVCRCQTVHDIFTSQCSVTDRLQAFGPGFVLEIGDQEYTFGPIRQSCVEIPGRIKGPKERLFLHSIQEKTNDP